MDFVYHESQVMLDTLALYHIVKLRTELTNGFSFSIWTGIDNVSWGFKVFLSISDFCAQKEDFPVIGFFDTMKTLHKGTPTLE